MACPRVNFTFLRPRFKCNGTRAENTFRLSAKRTSPFKSAGASVQSTTGSRGVRISGSNAVYTMLRGSVKGTGYPIHSPVSPSLPLPCVTVCHHISTGLYLILTRKLMELLQITHFNNKCACIDLLKPTGHVMHHQFNIQQLYALSALYLCVLFLSENKQRLVPLTA